MLTQVQRPNTSIQHMTDLEAKYLVTVVATTIDHFFGENCSYPNRAGCTAINAVSVLIIVCLCTLGLSTPH